MRPFFVALAFFTSLWAQSGAAQNATVVELYTSQGCSSCPPADAMLADLAKRDDVIALALHVDYWDYLGWKDELASPAFTRRQQAYARVKGSDTVYTPQMIFNGQDHVVGSRPGEVMDQLMAHADDRNPVNVALTRNGDQLRIDATTSQRFDTLAVQVVRYTPSVTVDIRRGENAGRSIHYANVVTYWDTIGNWNTTAPLQMNARVRGDDPIVVIIQQGRHGPIVGAAQLR